MRRVLRECERWGVPVEHVDALPDDLVHSPIISAGIAWPARRIVLTKEIGPSAALHELAHCIVGIYPSRVSEIASGMLAFEWAMQQRLRLPDWNEWMSNYGGYSANEWGQMGTHEKSELLIDSFVGAASCGILDSSWRPTYRMAPIGGL